MIETLKQLGTKFSKSIIAPIKKWKKRIKYIKRIKKAGKAFIKILGPSISIFLMVDGFLSKDEIKN